MTRQDCQAEGNPTERFRRTIYWREKGVDCADAESRRFSSCGQTSHREPERAKRRRRKEQGTADKVTAAAQRLVYIRAKREMF